jgi:uncharacterized membrane protein
MVLFLTLLFTVAVLVTVLVSAIAIGGTVGLVLFGDVIVFALIMIWIIKRLVRSKKK